MIIAILILPIFAIWYIWVKTKWNTSGKVVVTIIIVLVCISVGKSDDSEKSTSQIASNPQSAAPVVTETKSDTGDQQVSQPTEPTKPLSDEDQIKQLVSRLLKGNNNMDKPFVKKIDVVKQVDGGWGVFTEYNADDNLTTNLRKGGIEVKMSDIYMALYKSGKDIRAASVAAYFPLEDKYGNTSDGMVYKSILDKDEADKVNWQADRASLELSILPKVWTTSFIHPGFLE